MLQAYIDESGKGDKEGFLVLAGYIAPVEVWAERFTPAWQALLDEETQKWGIIRSFKMSKMIRDEALAERYYRVIEDSVTAEVSCTLDVAGLHKAYREFPWPFLITNSQKIINPYYFGFKAIMDMMAQHQHMLGINEPIDFIFDNTTEKGTCLEAWELIENSTGPDLRRLMGDTPSFKCDEKVLPLQSADLYAYWVREWDLQNLPDSERRFPWKRNRQIPRLAFRFEEKDFVNEFNKVFTPERANRIMRPGGSFPNESILKAYQHKAASTGMENKQIPISNSNSLRSEYANNVDIGLSPWDIRLTFTELAQNSDGTVSRELKGNIVMSPAHARAMHGALTITLSQYEEVFGKIQQPNTPTSTKDKPNDSQS